jgi:endonuclease/exonuclease/phosphatase (EEP) superfamily protein YafD
LNLTPWSPWWDALLEAGQLIDSRKGFGVHATWPANVWALMIPIDHVLVSQEVRVRRRRLGPALGSDHRPVVVDFEL